MKYKNAIALCLAAILVFGVTACGKGDKGPDGNGDNETTTSEKQETSAFISNIEKIDTDKLVKAANNIVDIKNNFDYRTDSSRVYMTFEGDTKITEVNTLQLIPKDTCSVLNNPDLTDLTVFTETVNNGKYPSTITIQFNYNSENGGTADFEKMYDWGTKMMASILNAEIGEELKKAEFNKSPSFAFESDNLTVMVAKSNIELTDTQDWNNVSLSASINTGDSDKEVNQTDFNFSENPECALFETPIMDYSEGIESINSRVASFFSDKANVEMVYARDIVRYTGNKKSIDSAVQWNIQSNGIDYIVKAKATNGDIDGTPGFQIDIEGEYCDNKLACLYFAEQAIEQLFGDKIPLDSYTDVDTFEVECHGEDLNTDFGLPAKVSGVFVEDGNGLCAVNLTFKTI